MADNDAVAAVVELLGDLADGRVYGEVLADDQTEHMPRRAIVVRSAGGAGTFGSGTYMPTIDDRVDVRCYGEDPWDSKPLAKDAEKRLHRAKQVQTAHGLIIWARRAGGSTGVTETQTGWPLTLTSWQVFGDWLDD